MGNEYWARCWDRALAYYGPVLDVKAATEVDEILHRCNCQVGRAEVVELLDLVRPFEKQAREYAAIFEIK